MKSLRGRGLHGRPLRGSSLRDGGTWHRGGHSDGVYKFANAEAEAVAAAMTTPPSYQRAALIDTFVGALKTAGIWADLDVMYVLAAADSQAALLNWKSPGSAFTAIEVNSPTFQVDRGYTGNGTSSRLRTQYTPSTNGVKYTQDDASIWVWSNTDAIASVRDIGNSGGPAVSIMTMANSVAMAFNVNDGTNSTSALPSSTSIGLAGASRASSSAKKAWKNGVQCGVDISVASTGVPTQEQWMCGANPSSFSTKQIAFAAWGASLSGKESAFYSAVLAYMQGVGAA